MDTTAYYIPFDGQTLVLMTCQHDSRICLRIGLSEIPTPEDARRRNVPDLWAFANYQMELSEPVTFSFPIPKFPTLAGMNRRMVKWGDMQRLILPGKTPVSALFHMFEYEGEAREGVDIFLDLSREALNPRRNTNLNRAAFAIRRFFTPYIRSRDEA